MLGSPAGWTRDRYEAAGIALVFVDGIFALEGWTRTPLPLGRLA